MLRMIAVVVAIAAAALLALAAMQPDMFRVQRSTTIAAPAARVFPLIDDFRRWTAWSPFETMDPTMRRTYGPTTAGTGATYAWEGEGRSGAGRMTIVDSTPPSRVGIVLEFLRPIENRAATTFTLRPQGDATLVTWTMESPNPFLVKLMHLFFDAEKLVGEDFARGLAALKAAAEK
jgi:uncharacterized protein YndB with AHSA1/START domain